MTDAAARDRALAYALFRATLGLNIFLHGATRIWSGAGKFAAGLAQGFAATPLPAQLVRPFGLLLPWLELAVGLLVLLGLFLRKGLVAGTLLMLALTFGTALQAKWDVLGLQLIYSFAYFSLLFLREYDAFSLDRVLRGRTHL